MPVDLSIIVPVYNEQDNILPLAEEVISAMKCQPRSYELVFVDDASTDATWERIKEAHGSDSRVRGLRHAYNRGQSAAVWTGIRATDSPIIATLDGDCQNDPADLLPMLERLNEVDFVSGWRHKRHDNLVRRVSSKVAHWARKKALKAEFRDTGCGIRAYKRSILEGIFPFDGLHRFMPILVHGNGARTLELPVKHRPRVAGVSKYGIWNRLGRGLYDLIGLNWYQKRRISPVPFKRLGEKQE